MSRLVLKASAGTGKTYRLSLEYLLSLYRGVPYGEIFIMTFTKKATAEIRERILEFAGEILKHSEKGEEIQKNLQALSPELVLEEEVLQNAYYAMIKNKEKIRIYTIDSFFQMIFHKIVCPCHQVYSMSMIEKREEIEEYYKKILKKIFLNKDLFQEMKEFLELSPEKNVENYLGLLNSIINERWKFLLLGKKAAREPLGYRKSWEDYVERFENLFQQMEMLKGKERNYFTNTFFQEFFQMNYDEKREKIEKEREVFLSMKLFDGRRLRENKKKVEQEELRQELIEEFASFQEDIAKTAYEEMMLYEEKLFAILEKIYSLYDEYKWQERGFTHNDVTIYTYSTLFQEDLGFMEEGKITVLLEESLDMKVHSVFLDEFQDTSILQWKILSLFLEKAENVICVGDEKQSIYGWRGGEKGLFESLDSILTAKVENMDTSYRSFASIVDATNQIFENYPKLYKEEKIHWNFSPSKSHKREEGEVSFHFSEKEESFEELIRLIQEKYVSRYGSLGILARKNKTLLEIANRFEREKIPYQLFSEEEHQEEEVISSFLSLFRYFITEKYLYLLEFFRSPLVKSSNRILKKLLLHKENVIQYIHFGMEQKDLPEECEKVREIYLLFQEEEGKIGDIWLKSLQCFSAAEYFSKDKNFIAWYRFQEILSSYTSWEEYFQALDQNRVEVSSYWEEENENSIQLMTIHKSKGLEFENVIYFDSKVERKGVDRRNLLFYCDFSRDYRELKDAFLTSSRYKKYLEYLPAPFPNYILEEKRKGKEEEINNFYVALTRAKCNLHLFLAERFEGRECLEGLAVKSFQNYISEPEEIVEKELVEGIVLPIWKEEKRYLTDEKQRPQKYTEQTERKRMEGIATHFFLEWLIYAEEEEVVFAKKKLFQEYANYFGLERMQLLFSEERIRNLLEKAPLIFSKDWDMIYTEYPILDRETQKKYVIDRLMIRREREGEKGRILIVDYKTGGSNEEQLKTYANLVRQSLEEEVENYNIQTKFLVLE